MRCETVVTTPRPWALGGTKETHVCGKPATHVCTGLTKKEKAGPEMYLCARCRLMFLKRNPDYKSVVRKLRKGKA